MELLLGLVIGAATAALGGWVGYFLARRSDDKKRTADVCIEFFSGEFSRSRTEFLSRYRNLSDEEVLLAARRDVATLSDIRQAAMDIFNRYDLIVHMLNEGYLDQAMFNEYIGPVIASDYEEADRFFAAVEQDFIERGIDDRRPFFPEIAKISPRRKKATKSLR